MRKQEFWKGALNPKNHLTSLARHTEIRTATGTHAWGVEADGSQLTPPEKSQRALLDIAQGLLERGQWTLPSWKFEQQLAVLFERQLNWKFERQHPENGNLVLKALPRGIGEEFKNSLVTGRWGCEARGDAASEILRSSGREGHESAAERQFLEQVLVPSLGFPLLDFLHLERDLNDLGLDPAHYSGQRADFVLETFRGTRLVIEIDGGQHQSPVQRALDLKRDRALSGSGWTVWRVPTDQLQNIEQLRRKLQKYLQDAKERAVWGVEQLIDEPRTIGLMTCVWGAAISARIHFLLLESLRIGILPWDDSWELAITEHETDIAQIAIDDFRDWFGRLRRLHGYSDAPLIALTAAPNKQTTNLLLEISVCNPRLQATKVGVPIAWSRPANIVGPIPNRKFEDRLNLKLTADEGILTSFVQDIFRKASLREKQYEIICRTLVGSDVIGLLPTGAGKSLTYQLSGLLLGGLTIYVSPLKSLLQDQHERLVEQGIELAQPLSSALNSKQKQAASAVLKSGSLRFLLVAPERFLMESFRTELAQYRAQYGDVTQVVIDECHCVSEWGHEFRPAYLSLSRIVRDKTSRKSVSAPLVALTGTASTIVLADVRRELGVENQEAIIRAQRLDREELEISCYRVPSKEKHRKLRDITLGMLAEHNDANDGVLVFCRFAGGLDGATGVNAGLLGVIDPKNMRFFCGEAPNWSTYAAFLTKKSVKTISREQVIDATPFWALKPDLSHRDWEDVKADVQRQFISGTSESFRVLVATSAFGMGIDKPSIRAVIHHMSPQSPEAYYQEIGRAGRDRQKSKAILLFSDEDREITDQLLTPEKGIEEVRQIYKAYAENNRFSGGDFIRTFYFHDKSYSGPEIERAAIVSVLDGIRLSLEKAESVLLPYQFPRSGTNPETLSLQDAVTLETTREYGLIRLIHLGVIVDYTKDYNAKCFLLELNPNWEAIRDDATQLASYFAEGFRAYVRRYDRRYGREAEQQILSKTQVREVEKVVAEEMVRYVYEQVERKRRQASRSMLEMVRKGVMDGEAFRRDLLLYLQVSERFTELLERLIETEAPDAWRRILQLVSSPDEFRELHGACARVLESYPTNVGLLLISAATRIDPSPDELVRSEEDLRAALKIEAGVSAPEIALDLGEEVACICDTVDQDLGSALRSVVAIWMLDNGLEDLALERYLGLSKFRAVWLVRVLGRVKMDLPEAVTL